jgi:NAD(P)-dependent dehydrogenase (short-subunit alcohol dehydrogenase family)
MTQNFFDLAGKVALVTGGNSGIGLGMAEAMAGHGADVCIWGTNPKKNAVALESLQDYGTKAHAILCDVSDQAAVEKSFNETLEVFGRIDGCFANAGVGGGAKRFQENTVEDWHRVTSVNLDGFFFTLRRAAEHMVERAQSGDPGGRLVGTSSLGAIMGMPMSQAYAGTKGAVISIMQGLAVGFARFGVTANSILPGHIHTPMTEENYKQEPFINAVMPRIPMRRWGTKEDFGGLAVYLMSNASAYHTGDSFLIDGGFRYA